MERGAEEVEDMGRRDLKELNSRMHVGRDINNVRDDMRLLEEYGLVRLAAGVGAGKRRPTVPEAIAPSKRAPS
jgi:predicted transcriptional regulator